MVQQIFVAADSGEDVATLADTLAQEGFAPVLPASAALGPELAEEVDRRIAESSAVMAVVPGLLCERLVFVEAVRQAVENRVPVLLVSTPGSVLLPPLGRYLTVRSDLQDVTGGLPQRSSGPAFVRALLGRVRGRVVL
jgi:hypothetical protein